MSTIMELYRESLEAHPLWTPEKHYQNVGEAIGRNAAYIRTAILIQQSFRAA
jgi:hypothetical protein